MKINPCKRLSYALEDCICSSPSAVAACYDLRTPWNSIKTLRPAGICELLSFF